MKSVNLSVLSTSNAADTVTVIVAEGQDVASFVFSGEDLCTGRGERCHGLQLAGVKLIVFAYTSDSISSTDRVTIPNVQINILQRFVHLADENSDTTYPAHSHEYISHRLTQTLTHTFTALIH